MTTIVDVSGVTEQSSQSSEVNHPLLRRPHKSVATPGANHLGEFRVLSGSGRGSQVRLIGRFAPATPRFYRFPAGMDSSPSAQVQLLP